MMGIAYGLEIILERTLFHLRQLLVVVFIWVYEMGPSIA